MNTPGGKPVDESVDVLSGNGDVFDDNEGGESGNVLSGNNVDVLGGPQRKNSQSGGSPLGGEMMDQSAGRRHRRHGKHHSKHHKKNSWLAHVKATMKLNRGKSFKQVLKLAKKSYKKSQSQSGGKKRQNAQSKSQRGGSGHASSSTFGANAAAYPA